MPELKLDSRYMMDKVAYYKTGHFPIESGKYDGMRVDWDFAHNLPFTPLIFGIYATTPDFSDAKDFNIQFGAVSVNLGANSEKIQGMVYNFSDKDIDFYYRIYAFEPSNNSSHLQTTAGSSHGFIINSGKFNYRKLFRAGTANLNNGQTEIVHQLGYKPQIMLWEEFSNGSISPFSETLSHNKAIVNTQKILITSSAKIIHYRIYHDGMYER